jgi:hypothetical protein
MVDRLQLAEIAGAKSKSVDVSSVILACSLIKLPFFLLFSLFPVRYSYIELNRQM